ncbi:hypothetical protein Srut_51000 [Streptomyces rutgersensis]|nr:hypothetical protein Srut_51000 [Streptomyces rutgersensis]
MGRLSVRWRASRGSARRAVAAWGPRQTSVSAPGRSPRLGFFRDGRSPLTAAPADGPHRSREAARAGDPHSAPARRPPAPVGGALREATRTEAGLRLTARLPPPS